MIYRLPIDFIELMHIPGQPDSGNRAAWAL
jgi:hypothetical protein